MKRGDVVIVRFPHASGGRGKKRPAVIVQADTYSARISTVVLAEATTNMSLANDPACLFIDVSTAEGAATGLERDSVVACFYLSTFYAHIIDGVLGTMSPTLMLQLDQCLAAALGLPTSHPPAANP
jgi:mRNA interferase MazF